MTRIKQMLAQVWNAGVSACDPKSAIIRGLRVHDGRLHWPGGAVHLPERVAVVSLGKAAEGMGLALHEVLSNHVYDGIIASPYTQRTGTGWRCMQGGHPLPNAASVRAGEAVRSLVCSVPPDALLIVAVSGGGSACVELPAPGADLAQIAALCQGMLHDNVSIQQLNAARARLSRIKGGGLARMCSAPLLTIVVSDVVGDPRWVASGPTIPPTGPDHPVWVPVDQRVAVDAICAAAMGLGLRVHRVQRPIIGQARDAAKALAHHLITLPSGTLCVSAGETTVTVRGDGRGGRNSELALAAAAHLKDHPITLLSAGSDGIDGPTPAAGAYVDGTTVRRCHALSLDPDHALARNDSFTALHALGDTLITGPTGTNVADLQVAWVGGRDNSLLR